MSIFGAMFSGVSGLTSQSQALGMISDNISNVNTTGYKRTRGRFSTLVTQNATQNSFSPGGVRANPYQEVAVQGLLQASASQTDVAIVGGGFFVVNEVSTPGLNNEYLYTRAGSFAPDKNGFLRNTASFYLMGWPTDATGTPTVANTSVLTSLSAINVAGISGSAAPTTAISIGANLPATAAIGNTQNVTVQVFDTLGVDHNVGYTFTKTAQNQWDIDATPADGTQVLTLRNSSSQIYDAVGRMDFDAVPSDGETIVIQDANAINPNLTFEFDTGGGVTAGNIAVNLTGVTTAAGAAAALNSAIAANSWGNYTSVTSLTNAVTTGGDITSFPASPTVVGSTTGITPAVDTIVQGLAGMTAGALQIGVEVTGAGPGDEIRFTGQANLKYGINGGAPGVAGANSGDLVGLAANSTVELYVNDGSNDILIATVTLPTAPVAAGVANGPEGSITLNTFTRAGDPRFSIGTGTNNAAIFARNRNTTESALTIDLSNITVNSGNNPPSAVTQATGAAQTYVVPQLTAGSTPGITFDSTGLPSAFNVATMDVTYSNGASAASAITLDFGTVGQGDGMTQFASDFIVYSISQNGVRFGTFNGVTIGDDGLVTALFDNGQSTPIYKIPVVTFPNPNGLFSKTGNVFAESDASGNGLINTAGSGSAGSLSSGSLEASTVDIATEFTNMIITQQAYSASARIISTADEMLDEVLRISR